MVTHPWQSQVPWAPLQGLWASAEQTPEAWPGTHRSTDCAPVLVGWAPEVPHGPPLVRMQQSEVLSTLAHTSQVPILQLGALGGGVMEKTPALVGLRSHNH